MLYVDAKVWLPDDLLIKADKMTMANGLELRVPFPRSQAGGIRRHAAERFKEPWKGRQNAVARRHARSPARRYHRPPQKGISPADRVVFLGLGKIGEGRTTAAYDKNQVIFAQGNPAERDFLRSERQG